MADETEVQTEAKPRAGRTRRVVTVVLLVIGLITGLIGNLSGWAWWLLLDRDHFVAALAPLSDEEVVADALAFELVDQLFTQIDIEDRIADALPERVSFLAGPITTGVREFSVDAAKRVIQTEEFKTVWREALERVHDLAMRVLRDEGDVVRTTGGVVTLDLSAVADRIDQRLEERGLDLFDPEDLPDDFGQIELFRSDQLEATQRAVELFDLVRFWMPLIALACFAGAIAVAPRRRRAVIWVGVSVGAIMLVELIALRLVRRALLDNARVERNREALEAVWDDLTEQLRRQSWALFIVGVLIAVVAWALGPAKSAVRLREGVRGRLDQLREGHVDESTQDRLARALAPWRRAIEVVILLLALVILIVAPTLTPLLVIVVALLTALLFAVVEVAAGPRVRSG